MGRSFGFFAARGGGREPVADSAYLISGRRRAYRRPKSDHTAVTLCWKGLVQCRQWIFLGNGRNWTCLSR